MAPSRFHSPPHPVLPQPKAALGITSRWSWPLLVTLAGTVRKRTSTTEENLQTDWDQLFIHNTYICLYCMPRSDHLAIIYTVPTFDRWRVYNTEQMLWMRWFENVFFVKPGFNANFENWPSLPSPWHPVSENRWDNLPRKTYLIIFRTFPDRRRRKWWLPLKNWQMLQSGSRKSRATTGGMARWATQKMQRFTGDLTRRDLASKNTMPNNYVSGDSSMKYMCFKRVLYHQSCDDPWYIIMLT